MPSQASRSCRLAGQSSGLWDYSYIRLSWLRGNWISPFSPSQTYNNHECCMQRWEKVKLAPSSTLKLDKFLLTQAPSSHDLTFFLKSLTQAPLT
jgi:hypothetical protein